MGLFRKIMRKEKKKNTSKKCAKCGGETIQPAIAKGSIVGVRNVRTSNYSKNCENCGLEYHLRCLNYEDIDGFLFASCPNCGSSMGVM